MNPLAEVKMTGITYAALSGFGIFCLQDDSPPRWAFPHLLEEAKQIVSDEKPSIVRPSGHITSWTKPSGEVHQYSLWNRHGQTDKTHDDHTRTTEKMFINPAKYPYLNWFCNAWPSLMTCRLNVMKPGSALSPHKENIIVRQDNGDFGIKVRFHLPLQTNAGSKMLLGDEIYRFEAGEIYYFNNGAVHASENKGEQDRMHLVFDSLYTKVMAEFMAERFFAKGSMGFTVDLPKDIPTEATEYNPDIHSIKFFQDQ